MTGKLFIDGQDAFSSFGVYITKGSYKELLTYPALKEVQNNDWAEEDGIEVDLSNPTLDTREFNISFASLNSGHNQLVQLLSDGAYHSFDFRELEKVYVLRLVSQPNFRKIRDLSAFSFRFANDFPFSEYYEYEEPQAVAQTATGYLLDGIDLSKYGIIVLKGSEQEVLKLPTVKKNLLTNLNNEHGAFYDDEWVKFQAKDVKINCLMRASNLNEFWRNYNALLYDLIRKNERGLYVSNVGNTYPCYYKNCSGAKFAIIDGRIWFEFSLTFVFTTLGIKDGESNTYYLLATEDDILVCTEDGRFFIDLEGSVKVLQKLLSSEDDKLILTEQNNYFINLQI